MTVASLAQVRPPTTALQQGTVRPLSQREIVRGAMFIGAHVPLGMLMKTFPWISTLHAVATLGISIIVAASAKRLSRLTSVVAYIAGAEVLWRMTKATVFWEYGKYATCAVVLVGLLRVQGKRNRSLALAYIGLLLPSVALTFLTVDLDDARQQISFNLSGPLTVALCALLFSNVRLTQAELRRTFIMLIAPVVAISTLSYLSTVSFDVIEFSNQSNNKTTSGFGPNQVSAVLGLAAMFGVMFLFERNLPWRARAPILVLSLIVAVQSALTFSRGGLLLAGMGLVTAALYMLRDRRQRITIITLSLLLLVVGKFVIEPRLEAFTSGALHDRFANTASTGRDKFVAIDLQIFADNPIAGVGPGMADPIRSQMGHVAISHTEYTRMLSEHGVLGLLSLIVLIVLSIRVVKDAKDIRSRAFVAAMIVWAALFLSIYAMRLAAPGVVFGLACAISRSSMKAGRQ